MILRNVPIEFDLMKYCDNVCEIKIISKSLFDKVVRIVVTTATE